MSALSQALMGGDASYESLQQQSVVLCTQPLALDPPYLTSTAPTSRQTTSPPAS